MSKAGVKDQGGGAVSSLQGEWVSCDRRSFNPDKPFWVCVLRDYKWW